MHRKPTTLLTSLCLLLSLVVACSSGTNTSSGDADTRSDGLDGGPIDGVDSDASERDGGDAVERDDGDAVESGDGDAVECARAEDCASGVCTNGSCATPTCSDGALNGEETDVDCGGVGCAACEIGGGCSANSDCASGLCDTEVCIAMPTCDDLAANGSETDVDCGGAECPSCQDGQMCQAGTDCTSGVCGTDGLCAAPACDDTIANGLETDVDCGGADCPACALGASCVEGTDCSSGVCGGDNTCGDPVWSTVSTYSQHTCAVRSDGTLWCWGTNNTSGFLGTGDLLHSYSPTQIGTDSDWATVSTGKESTCGIRTDGTLWCWGERRAIGQPDPDMLAPPSYYSPLQVTRDSDWVDVSVGWQYACGTRTDDTLWCWGRNVFGQLGTGGLVDTPLPTLVGAYGSAPISTRYVHTCGVRSAGSLWCWGMNKNGQIGDGTVDPAGTYSHDTPTQVGIDVDWESMATTESNTLGVRTDGSLWGWGVKGYIIEADGVSVNRTSPGQIGTAMTWASVSGLSYHACAIQDDGSLWCWGANGAGQASTSSESVIALPTQYGTATWSTISAGASHNCGIQTDGSLWCWGSNGFGQLGDGTTAAQPEPIEITVP